MRDRLRQKGVVLLLTVFVVALLAAVVIGLLQLKTLETQLMNNQVCAAQALAVAQAGLNDAFAAIRLDSSWDEGFADKAFDGGSYTVLVMTVDPSSDPIPPTVTDNELDGEALGPIYPGATQDFAVYHPDLAGVDFDSRASITINAGSYYYNGVMNGSPFTLSIPLDATEVSIQITLKKLDYPQIPENVNCQMSWTLSSGSGASAYPTIISEGTSAQGYVARVAVDVTIGRVAPYTILINEMRINE